MCPKPLIRGRRPPADRPRAGHRRRARPAAPRGEHALPRRSDAQRHLRGQERRSVARTARDPRYRRRVARRAAAAGPGAGLHPQHRRRLVRAQPARSARRQLGIPSGWMPCCSACRFRRALGREGAGDFTLDQGQLLRGGDLVYTGAQILRTDGLARDPRNRLFAQPALGPDGRARASLWPDLSRTLVRCRPSRGASPLAETLFAPMFETDPDSARSSALPPASTFPQALVAGLRARLSGQPARGDGPGRADREHAAACSAVCATSSTPGRPAFCRASGC